MFSRGFNVYAWRCCCSLENHESGSPERNRTIHPGKSRLWQEVKTVQQTREQREQRKGQKSQPQKRPDPISPFVREFADELNNLLAAIWGNVVLAKKKLDPESSVFRHLCQVERVSFRAKETIQYLLAFSCCREPLKKRVDITALLRETAAITLGGCNVAWRFSVSSKPEQVNADPLQMKEVFHNLLSYARETMPNGGSIVLATERLIINGARPIFNEGIVIKVTVCSQGEGNPRVEGGRIFDFAGISGERPHPRGPELSLALSHAIVRKHDGLLTVHSEISIGTELSLYLPAAGS